MRRPWTEADDDVLEELYAKLDALSDERGQVERLIWELEEARGNREERELQRDYYASR